MGKKTEDGSDFAKGGPVMRPSANDGKLPDISGMNEIELNNYSKLRDKGFSSAESLYMGTNPAGRLGGKK